MSYSFTVRAPSKAEAREKVAIELARVVSEQPVHAEDHLPAKTAADSFIALIRNDPEQDVCVSVSGSCSSTEAGLSQAGVSISAYLVARA